jgi:hypothetical protein
VQQDGDEPKRLSRFGISAITFVLSLLAKAIISHLAISSSFYAFRKFKTFTGLMQGTGKRESRIGASAYEPFPSQKSFPVIFASVVIEKPQLT